MALGMCECGNDKVAGGAIIWLAHSRVDGSYASEEDKLRPVNEHVPVGGESGHLKGLRSAMNNLESVVTGQKSSRDEEQSWSRGGRLEKTPPDYHFSRVSLPPHG